MKRTRLMMFLRADTTSSVDVIALVFGLKVAQPEGPDDLGQELTTVIAPKFSSTGPQGQFVQNVNLVIPSSVVNGVSGTFNLTCGEFLTLGVSGIRPVYSGIL